MTDGGVDSMGLTSWPNPEAQVGTAALFLYPGLFFGEGFSIHFCTTQPVTKVSFDVRVHRSVVFDLGNVGL